MRYLSYLLIILLLFTTLLGCEKEEEIYLSATDYLIFGHFYGECLGDDCVKTYRLEENRLLEITDLKKNKHIVLSESKFNLAKDLRAHFPSELLNEKNESIGTPDAGDWGGLYIEYNYEGKRQFWFIDLMKSNVPDYLHDFIDKVREKIRLIRE